MNDEASNPRSDAPENTQREQGMPLSRRRLIKGAVATAPFIATLPSGAALARSSNVISGTTPAGALDAQGRTLCLDVGPGTGPYTENSFDLGEPPSGWVTAITERDYQKAADANPANAVTEADMCRYGGSYYYMDGGWKQVNVPRGMLASATALMSFAGSIVVTEI